MNENETDRLRRWLAEDLASNSERDIESLLPVIHALRSIPDLHESEIKAVQNRLLVEMDLQSTPALYGSTCAMGR